jgi:hypothetical protein
MRTMGMYGLAFARAGLLGLSVLVAACSSMRPVESPSAFLERNNPKHVRVYSPDGELIVLREPQLRGDSVRGFEPGAQEEMSFRLGDIRRMDALQPDKTRTTLFIGAMALIGGAGIYMIANASDGKGLICDSYDNQNRCVPRQAVVQRARLSIPLLRF